MPQITVGFLGLGIMGTAMARNLLKKKGDLFADVVIWNRTASKVGSFLRCARIRLQMLDTFPRDRCPSIVGSDRYQLPHDLKESHR